MTDGSKISARTSGVRRRQLLAGAAVAGLGALVAVEVANSSGRPIDLPLLRPAVLTDDVKLRHLLRRAGFGASATEFEQYRQLGLSRTIDRLLNYEGVDNGALEARLKRLHLNMNVRGDLERWWLLRMIYTARPLEEKMTLFWHGLLTSAISKVGRAEPMYVQNQFLRASGLGSFADILKGISKDPAMMVWLDLQTNRKGHANENYARELMELFSMGVGHYTEQDVRESARAFTGWAVRRKALGPKEFHFESVFLPRQHDEGSKTFLGHTGNFNGDDVVDIIVQQPATADYLARRLFAFFAYPNPTDDVLKPLVDAYTASHYSIKAMLRALFTSEAFYAPRAYRSLIKSPAELVAGTARVLGADVDGRGLPQMMVQMGQELFNPPNVAGWPGGAAWLTSGTWLARLNFVNRVVASLGPTSVSQQISRVVARDAAAHVPSPTDGATSPDEIVDRLAGLLLDGHINSVQRQILVDYATGGARTGSPSATPAWQDERHRGALYLALAMPEYHLA